MTTGRILVVCTGNICRSPVAEALLSNGLADRDLTVRSAGTEAMLGYPPVPEAKDFIDAVLGGFAFHLGEQLDKQLIERADLVLTMTEEHRTFTVQLVPRAVRRTFTMLEFARMVRSLDRAGPFEDLPALVRACAPLRRQHATPGAPSDIPDPIGRPSAAYAHSFSLVAQACSHIVDSLITHLPSRPPAVDQV